MQIETYLPYLLPPLLGALIGYVTNYIAIRMLFRPLRPWYLFGIRIPLTPGIIPARRGELARRIGDMVGGHLLTADDVGRALQKEGFRRELQGALRDKLDQFVGRELGPPVELVPREMRNRFRDLVDMGRWKVVARLGQYLASDDFADELHGYLQRQGDALLSRDLSSFLTEEREEALQGHIREKLGQWLQSPELARTVERLVDDRVESLLQSRRSLREILPSDLVDLVLNQLEQELPELLEKLSTLLYDPDVRQRLIVKAREGIEGFLDSLEGLAGLLSGFVNLDNIYERLPEFIDKAADEMARWLKEERTRQQVAALLRERAEQWLDRPVASYLEKWPYEKVAGVRRFLREQAVDILRGARTRQALTGMIELGYNRIKDRSFQSILQGALPPDGVEKGRALLEERLLALLRDPQAERWLDSQLAALLDELLFHKSLGRLAPRIPADLREELEAGLYRQLADVLKKEVPPLVESLNVARIVSEKVDALDVLEVEGLLMGIMKEQFKYINLFGALLGGLIGLVNLLLLL
ncbi:MAG: DUF445 domain-containing protein [Desulfuromonas sp.]|nr:MAG: DUF445 domain-containing protein [Desulfuromonas sp.]